jgi:hypothetical protein
MNPDLEKDLQRWEAGRASLDEIDAHHPGQDVRGLAELHARLALLAQEATPDPQAGWELLKDRLPEKVPNAVRTDRPGRRRRYRRAGKRVAVLGLAAAVMLTSGLAVAGALPAPAQNAIANIAGHLGVDLPHASEPSDVTSHGEEISNFAHSTDAEGCEKGKAVSAMASAPAEDHRRNPAGRPDPCQKKGTGGPSGAGEAPGSTAPAGSGVGSDAARAHRQGGGFGPAGVQGSASNSDPAPKGMPTKSAAAP